MPNEKKKYQLVTRSDMDGLVCAVLLKEMGMIDKIKFAHPKDVQVGKLALSENDITANVPYAESLCMAFDHHGSEPIRVKERKSNHIVDPGPSASSVI